MRAWPLVPLLLLVLYGCGQGSAQAPSSPSGSGRAVITVVWPPPSRLIPAAAQSIRIDIAQSGRPVESQTLQRPEQGGTATVVFDPLPVGRLTATATAFPEPGARGTPQATASTEIDIEDGRETTFSITMQSTIERLEVTPSEATLQVGETITLAVAPRDNRGNLVLILPTSLRFESSSPAVVTVAADGKLTAVSPGSAQVTVRETESERTAAVQVTVQPPQPPPPALSQSRLSIHLIARYTNGARQIVAAGPRVLKILDLGADMREALRDYKTRYPNGQTLLRIFTRKRYTRSDNPEASARDFWNTVLAPPINALPPEERRLIDYVEGPNEGDSTPTWETLEDAVWYGRFSAELARVIGQNGFRPCVGSIAVGNPPGTPQEIEARLEAFVPALRAAKAASGAWSYHSYTIEYTTDPGVEYWFSLRYRQFYDFLRRRHPDLANLPLILSEGGVDRDGNPQTSGWQARGTAEDFKNWLRWLDSELRRDSYVVGITLFQSGDTGGWPSFEIEPIAGWMADYLNASRKRQVPASSRTPRP
ncbi:MAG: Ig-like domain-containing protein [Chloroherpetonaceae bacterium]|nr:Ig-like domain-containing protein [Chthonomonadaceae bacterium]MDW8209218.1 Ig-like domain-containing protein [Chloroherpetonaceae bacterium]